MRTNTATTDSNRGIIVAETLKNYFDRASSGYSDEYEQAYASPYSGGTDYSLSAPLLIIPSGRTTKPLMTRIKFESLVVMDELIKSLAGRLLENDDTHSTSEKSEGFYGNADQDAVECMASDLDIQFLPPKGKRKTVRAKVKTVRKMEPKIHLDEEWI